MFMSFIIYVCICNPLEHDVVCSVGLGLLLLKKERIKQDRFQRLLHFSVFYLFNIGGKTTSFFHRSLNKILVFLYFSFYFPVYPDLIAKVLTGKEISLICLVK